MTEAARITWQVQDDYDEIGGRAALEEALRDALRHTPREHLRQLSGIIVQDRDPKGRALGVWRFDLQGPSIELYVAPHVADVLRAPTLARSFTLRLYLAHTLFHEVGHHVTLHLNRRAEPSCKKSRVSDTLEKWAEQYVLKRLQRLCDGWLAPGGPASTVEGQRALGVALRFLGLEGQIRLPETFDWAGTFPAAVSSNSQK